MNDNIIFALHNCVKKAEECKKIGSEEALQQFEYWKGRIKGILFICKLQNLTEELNLGLRLCKSYPFTDTKPLEGDAKIIKLNS